MKTGKISRRSALSRLVQISALAAGLSAAETEKLLAQIATEAKSLPDVTKLLGISARDNNVKALKVLLMPRSRMAQVFQSEFGRAPQFTAKKYRSGGAACPAFIGTGDSSRLECGIHVCNAATCQAYNILEDKASAKNLNEIGNMQDCVSICNWFCLIVFCFKCPKFMGPDMGGVNSNWLSQMRNDPFVQSLFKEFNLTSADDLNRELRLLLNKRKAEM
jgi:hypothetical protein